MRFLSAYFIPDTNIPFKRVSTIFVFLLPDFFPVLLKKNPESRVLPMNDELPEFSEKMIIYTEKIPQLISPDYRQPISHHPDP